MGRKNGGKKHNQLRKQKRYIKNVLRSDSKKRF